MKPVRSTFFPVVPMSAMRSTKNMYWLVAKPEEYAMELDSQWEPIDRNGKLVYQRVVVKKDGTKMIKTRTTRPNYTRQRKYLVGLIENKKAILEHAKSLNFVFPEDAFAIVVAMPMPKSWTKKKKRAMAYCKHKSKPDSDNIYKNITDAIFYKEKKESPESILEKVEGSNNDSRISSYTIVKFWAPDDFKPGFGFFIDEYEDVEFDLIFLGHHIK